jgi:hypothetical protein
VPPSRPVTATLARVAQDRGARVVIGLAFVAGSLVLLYFSSTPSLTCVAASEYAECTVTARMAGAIEVDRRQLTGVRSVGLQRTAIGSSDTPPHLVFRDATTAHDLGYFSQRFAPQWQVLDAFVRQPTAAGVRLGEPRPVRQVAAHAAALLMILLGLSMLWSARRRA